MNANQITTVPEWAIEAMQEVERYRLGCYASYLERGERRTQEGAAIIARHARSQDSAWFRAEEIVRQECPGLNAAARFSLLNRIRDCVEPK